MNEQVLKYPPCTPFPVLQKSRDGLRCAEAGCDFTASHLKTFSAHLVQHHNIQMNIIKLIFKDWNGKSSRTVFETVTGVVAAKRLCNVYLIYG